VPTGTCLSVIRCLQCYSSKVSSPERHSWPELSQIWSAGLQFLNNLFFDSVFRPRPYVSGYFWIRNFFFPDSKIFPSTRSVFKSNSPVHTHPMVIHCRETGPSRRAAILVYCSVRDWTRFCYVIGSENIGIHRPNVIGFVADLFFSTLESGLKNIRVHWYSSDACGRKPYPERKSCGLKNIRIRVDRALVKTSQVW